MGRMNGMGWDGVRRSPARMEAVVPRMPWSARGVAHSAAVWCVGRHETTGRLDRAVSRRDARDKPNALALGWAQKL